MGYKPQQNPTKIIEEIAQIDDKKLARTTLQIQKKNRSNLCHRQNGEMGSIPRKTGVKAIYILYTMSRCK